MAKVTAVIDIGSNSARMVVFQRTSRFGFFLLHEAKSRVRISEGAYQNDGNLQEEAMERACRAIGGFLSIARSFKTGKILCVATSAVRDAPNKAAFLERIRTLYNINIKVIPGEQEALYGGVAAVNLLPLDDGVTVDIGGGSTELALIRGGKIQETISFNLGTVRLKELFIDRNANIREAIRFVREQLKTLPDHFRSQTVIGIGGTLRSLAESIQKRENYPLKALHGYCYRISDHHYYLDDVITSDLEGLRKFGFKSDRLDVIRQGTLIFQAVAKEVGADKVVTSGVGVREGVFLADLLRNAGHRFPANFNPSVRSISDRLQIDGREALYLHATAMKLFDLLKPVHLADDKFRRALSTAAKLSSLGVYINFYHRYRHGHNIILQGLVYGFTHEERILIANLIRLLQRKELNRYATDPELTNLLPSAITVKWLAFILLLAVTINADRSQPAVEMAYEEGTLTVTFSNREGYLAQDGLRKLKAPGELEIVFREE